MISLSAGHLLKTPMLRIRQIISGYECFDEYGVTFDGTPYFSEEEAIILRILTKD